jgi:hypothetical protein
VLSQAKHDYNSCFPVLAGAQFTISPSVLDIDRRIEIGVRAVTTDHAAKRLLVGPVGFVRVVAHAAFLRGIGALDSDCGDASFGGIPGDLRVRVLSKALVDRAVDLLAHMAGETLPALATGRREFLDTFLLQARAQLRLAPPLLAVALLSFPEFAVKGAVVLAGTGRQEVGNAHIHADHRSRRGCVDRDLLVITEGHPPAITTLVEGHAGIDGLACERLAVVGSQLDGDQHLLAEFERADREPVVKGRVLRGSQCDNIDVGLDAGLPEHRDVPLAPRGFLCPCIQNAFTLLLVVVQQGIRIVLVGLLSIGAPGLGDACRLLDGHPRPSFRKGRGKERGTYLIRTLLGTEQGDVLLAERQVDLGEIVQGGEFARIDRFQPDVGHGSGERLRVVWPPVAVLTLLHLFSFLRQHDSLGPTPQPHTQ